MNCVGVFVDLIKILIQIWSLKQDKCLHDLKEHFKVLSTLFVMWFYSLS